MKRHQIAKIMHPKDNPQNNPLFPLYSDQYQLRLLKYITAAPADAHRKKQERFCEEIFLNKNDSALYKSLTIGFAPIMLSNTPPNSSFRY